MISSDYRAGFPSGLGFGGDVGFGVRPVLIIIDLTNGFTDPGGPMGGLWNVGDVMESNRRLLDVARKKGILIAFTAEIEPDAGSPLARKVKNVSKLKGKWIEVDPRLKPLSSEQVIQKKYASAFFGTGLASLLVAQKIDTVILTGCATSGCVRASAVDSTSSGFYTVIPAECVADRSEAVHKTNLHDIGQTCADVLPLKTVLDYVNRLR